MQREFRGISIVDAAKVLRIPHVVELYEDEALKVNYYHSPRRDELYMKATLHKSTGRWAYSAPIS